MQEIKVKLSPGQYYSDIQPPTIPVSDENLQRPGYRNLEGEKIGKLTVIGHADSPKSKWVVKCECGKFEIRQRKSLKRDDFFTQRCAGCQIKLQRAMNKSAKAKKKPLASSAKAK